MTTPDIHRFLLHPIHSADIEYMVTGSVAAIAYGEPRMTNDVDIVMRLSAADGDKLIAAFSPSDYYVPPAEVIEQERSREQHGHFNIIHHDTALRADVYLAGLDPLHEWALSRRIAARIGGDEIWFAPVEYVIVRKLEFFRESRSDRHIRDIRGMLRVSGDTLDRTELERLVVERALTEVWREVG